MYICIFVCMYVCMYVCVVTCVCFFIVVIKGYLFIYLFIFVLGGCWVFLLSFYEGRGRVIYFYLAFGVSSLFRVKFIYYLLIADRGGSFLFYRVGGWVYIGVDCSVV